MISRDSPSSPAQLLRKTFASSLGKILGTVGISLAATISAWLTGWLEWLAKGISTHPQETLWAFLLLFALFSFHGWFRAWTDVLALRPDAEAARKLKADIEAKAIELDQLTDLLQKYRNPPLSSDERMVVGVLRKARYASVSEIARELRLDSAAICPLLVSLQYRLHFVDKVRDDEDFPDTYRTTGLSATLSNSENCWLRKRTRKLGWQGPLPQEGATGSHKFFLTSLSEPFMLNVLLAAASD